MPSPSTRSSSLKPVLILSSFSRRISERRAGLAAAIPAPLSADIRPFPAAGAIFVTGSSTSVFQARQAGHCPSHLDDSYPHSLQKNAVVFAFAIIYALFTALTFTEVPSSNSTLTLNLPLILVFMLPTATSSTYTS